MNPEIRFPNVAPTHDKEFLALAAFFEGIFSIDWLVELSQRKVSRVLLELERGVQEGWLIRKAPGAFCFTELKERQKWQANLPTEKKERINQQMVELLLREMSDDDSKALAIAPYLLLISNDQEKCRWLMRAGNIHRRAFRIEEALQCYTKVLSDLSGLSGEEIDSLFTKAAIQYSKISTAKHDTIKVLSILQEAMIRARRWSKQTDEALLKMHLAKNEWLRAQYSSALRHFEQGWSIVKELKDPILLRSATTFSTFFLYWQGRFREAVKWYEKSVPEIEKYPQGRFPLLAGLTMAQCYAHIGQITQGLGMLDGIRTHCRESGDQHMEALSAVAMGVIMLDMHRIDDVIQYVESAVKQADQLKDEWVQMRGCLILAFAHYLKKKNKRSMKFLNAFLHRSRQLHVTVEIYPYLMELCWVIDQGRLPQVSGLSLKSEINRMINGENIYMRGVAYRYEALLQRKEGLPPERIIESLSLSLRWLEESGHQIQLARSQMELARQYLSLADEEKAREMTLRASKILYPINEILIPDDLRSLIKNRPQGETLLKEILNLGQQVVAIRDNKELMQQIVSTVNRITGAERGAIFLTEENTHPPRLQLKASKNITSDQISSPNFNSSIKMIEEVSLNGKGRIETNEASDLSSLSIDIRSRICVPMILRDKMVGVLYHDNRILSSAFRESDLELLAYFAALAAFAMDNTKAYEETQRLNQKLKQEKQYYEEQHLQNLHFEDIVGESPPILLLLAQIDKVASTESNVLILGETGVGKELVARAIHRSSGRRQKPFIRVHCSALPESLIPSELFGHERGAFTGASQRRIGRFELADGGTLFLDEIGDLSLEVQVLLLRVLQSKEFERVGGSQTLRSDFRLVAATNRNLEQLAKADKFRLDLFYRINVFPINVPPLRERKEDIPLLVHYFLKIYATKMGKSFQEIPKAEMDKIIHYDWPGNVRELENIIERGSILNSGPLFHVPELGLNHSEFSRMKDDVTLNGNERRHILWALQKTGWKVRGDGGAAELLKVHPSTLAFRMKKLAIQRPPGHYRRKGFREGNG
jgi:transcriptional regulator with GAF, ATPase, and Fis domain